MATWGIHHTSLVVSDADKALRFYRDGLGLELVGDVEEQTERLAQQVEVPGAWIRCMWLKTPDSNTLLELLEYKNPPGKKFDLTLIREQQRHQLESHLAAAAELGRSCGVTEEELTVLLRRAWEESQ